MSSRFVLARPVSGALSLSVAEPHPTARIRGASPDGQVWTCGLFLRWAIVNPAAMNVHEQFLCGRVFAALGCTPGEEVLGVL